MNARHALLASACALALSTASATQAQTASPTPEASFIDEVVVTAQKR